MFASLENCVGVPMCLVQHRWELLYNNIFLKAQLRLKADGSYNFLFTFLFLSLFWQKHFDCYLVFNLGYSLFSNRSLGAK